MHKKLATPSAGDNPLEVDTVTWRKQEKCSGERPTQRQCSQPRNQYRKQQLQSRCTRCGREPHSRRVCPAREAVCHKCGKRGHFSTQCRPMNTISQISVVVVEDTDVAVDTGFLDTDGGVFWTCGLDSCSTIGRADSTV